MSSPPPCRRRDEAAFLSAPKIKFWDEIGKLAATAIIRTALNYFLSREMQEYMARDRQKEADMLRQVQRPREAET